MDTRDLTLIRCILTFTTCLKAKKQKKYAATVNGGVMESMSSGSRMIAPFEIVSIRWWLLVMLI